jgi:hypothetical protein
VKHGCLALASTMLAAGALGTAAHASTTASPAGRYFCTGPGDASERGNLTLRADGTYVYRETVQFQFTERGAWRRAGTRIDFTKGWFRHLDYYGVWQPSTRHRPDAHIAFRFAQATRYNRRGSSAGFDCLRM